MSSHPAGIGGSWLVGRGGGLRSSGWRGEPEVHERACVGYLGAPWRSVFGSRFPCDAAVTARARQKHRTKLQGLQLLLGLSTGQKGCGKGNRAVAAGRRPCCCHRAAPWPPAQAGFRRDSHGTSRSDQGAF